MEIKENINKIYLITDTHFGVKSNSLAWKDDQSDYLLGQFKNEVTNNEPDLDRVALFVLGDIFHSRESINTMVGTVVKNVFTELATVFRGGVYLIVGNHDSYYKDETEVNSLSLIMDNCPGIKVIKNPTDLAIKNQDGLIKMQLMPWIANHDRLFSELSASDAPYLFGHLEITGARQNRYTSVREGIGIDVLKKYKRIYSGHIHIRQEIGSILYIGAPYQMDRGDIDNERGYYVLKCQGSDLIESFVPNVTSPKFIECDAFDLFNMNAAELAGVMNNNYVDINISSAVARFINMDVATKFFRENGIRPKKFEFIPYVAEILPINENEEQITKALGLTDMARTFLRSTKKYNEVETTNIMGYFEDLYNRAKTLIA